MVNRIWDILGIVGSISLFLYVPTIASRFGERSIAGQVFILTVGFVLSLIIAYCLLRMISPSFRKPSTSSAGNFSIGRVLILLIVTILILFVFALFSVLESIH